MGVQLALVVVTLNVFQTFQSAPERYAAIEAGLQAAGADVVTLQEVRRLSASRTSVDALLKGWNRAIDGRFSGYHLAILSRHPIKRTLPIPFRNNRSRMALGAVLDVRGQEVLVITTHLNYKLKDHAARRVQLEAIVGAAAAFKGPVVLTGDFNFGDGAPEQAALPDTWGDAFRVLHPKDPGYTWDNDKNPMAMRGRLPGEPSRRLDRVFARGLRPEAAGIVFDHPVRPGLFPSDHFGVKARLVR